jgi:hypothetical protein
MGYYLSKDKTALEKWIKSWEGGGPECYYTCTRIVEIDSEDTDALNDFLENNETRTSGVYHSDKLAGIQTNKGILNFYRLY